MRVLRGDLILVVGLAVLAMPAYAHAASPVEAAQSAFDEGRRLEDAGDFAAAAARFEESERLEPALGTILNLANCYEHARRFASAWRAFRRGAEEAIAIGEAKRALRASDRANALRPRLSAIAVRPNAGAAADEEVRVDGAALDRAEWGTPLPVDGGKHVIVARAAGRSDRTLDVVVADEGEHATVEIPVLLPEARTPQAAMPGRPNGSPGEATPPPRLDPPRAPSTWSPLRLAAIASGGLGLVAVGFGVGYGLQASARWSDRQADCAYNYCTEAGYSLTAQAKDAATRSTVAFAIGGGGLAAGTVLFVLSSRGGKGGMSVGWGALPGGAALHWEGTF